jgi:AAA15 family ATPase/GTPase
MDLSDTEKVPLSHAFIYGENGSGKSNLVESVLFLIDTMKTINVANTSNSMRNLSNEHDASVITERNKHAGGTRNSIQPPISPNELMRMTELLVQYDITTLAKIVRTVDSDGGVSASYHFVLEGHDGHYEMRFGSDNRLIYEKLSYVIESRTKDIFEIIAPHDGTESSKGVHIETKFSPQLFVNEPYCTAVEDLVQKYWGRHSFMSIMNDQYCTNNSRYMDESVGTGIADVIRFFNGLIVCHNRAGSVIGIGIKDKILSSLSNGQITPDEKPQLLAYEEALNSFFTRIYSDVKKAYYRIDSRGGTLYYTLVFSKMIGGKRRDIEIFEESSGTIRILGLFPAFLECARGKTVFYDEIDSGVHDLLIKDVISELKSTFRGQFIATTHNTSLLEVIDPKNIFVIQVDSRGEKRVISINRIERTQRNHNNRIRYMNGVFGSIPIIGEIDFDDIVRRVEHELGGGT